MSELLDDYRGAAPEHDEVHHSSGAARRGWDRMATVPELSTFEHLDARRRTVDLLLADHGVTYGGGDREVPWRLDPLPLLVDEGEWQQLETGLRQRTDVLEALLVDLYGPRRLLRSGLVPPAAVLAHPGFVRDVDGVRLPTPRQLFLSATDLCRAADGTWRVISDRTGAPSGAGYALEDRRVLSQVMAEVYRDAAISRLGPFFHALRQALLDVAPPGTDEPRIALLSPGADSETAYDQSFLSTHLGIPLVEGRDLQVRDGRVWMRGVGSPEPVDVVLRRVDATSCDPLDLDRGSRLGVPGLVRAVQGGGVSVVNTLGSGVLENPALMPYLGRVARAVLDQDLQLDGPTTYWAGDPAARSHVLAHLDSLVVKRTSRGTGAADTLLGWELGTEELDTLRRRIEAHPERWVGQELVETSTAPTVGTTSLEPRETVLRTFALAHRDDVVVMAGGLARVAPAAGPHHVVTNATGAVAKDVWVASSRPYAIADPWVSDRPSPVSVRRSVTPRVAEAMFWMGRYAERAGGTVRLMRATRDRREDFLHSPGTPGGAALAVLTDALRDVAAPGSLRDLLTDTARRGTVAYDLARLDRACHSVRDQLSSDTWLALAAIERSLAQMGATDPGEDVPGVTAEVLDALVEGLLAFAGIAAESMVRDVAWRFLEAGRRLERALGVVATLRATVVEQRREAVDSLVLESLLLTHESVITYRRRYQGGAAVATVLDLLLTDETNPRALRFQLDVLRDVLAPVPSEPQHAEALDRLLQDASDLVAEASTPVLGRPDDGDGADGADGAGGGAAHPRTRLAELLESLRWRLEAVSDELTRTHFVRDATARDLDDAVDEPPTATDDVAPGGTPTGPELAPAREDGRR